MTYMRLPRRWEHALQGGVGSLLAIQTLYRDADKLFAPQSGSQTVPIVFPARESLFRAFHIVQADEVRIVVLGQDPYPQVHPSNPSRGIADGLAFSARGQDPPESLRRLIYNLWISSEIRIPPIDADLQPWADRGVLLLNTALTVEPAPTKPERDRNLRRHQAVYKKLVRHVLELTSRQVEPPGYILLGAEARKFRDAIHAKDADQVIEAQHPSRGPWPGPRDEPHPFAAMNRYLGHRAIDWSLN